MFCNKCGSEITGDFCPKCVCHTQNINVDNQQKNLKNSISGLKTAAKIFMVIGCVLKGLFYISLAWTIPMTFSYCKQIKSGESITVGFKIATLLFVSTIAGILMLCDKN